ncbi:MAG: hypothetical protein ISS28_03040 [Candidatus Cloacimonetes bacterium]|nr:hypothetical protein [Candidatus Cloacimonadota bacterium]
MKKNYITLCLLIIVFFTACTKFSEKCNLTDNEIINLFGNIKEYSNEDPDKINLIFDCSKSFKGFINGKGCDFIRKIHSICVTIPEEKINFYKVGNVGTELKFFSNNLIEGLKHIQNKDFYGDSNTDLNPIFNVMDDTTAINFLFTDGIFSSQDSEINQLKFIKNIKNYLIKNDGFMIIFEAKAEFNGLYWTQTGTQNFEFIGDRPFLCIVFGNKKYIRFVEENIENKFENCLYLGKKHNYKLEYEPYYNININNDFDLNNKNDKIMRIANLKSDSIVIYLKAKKIANKINISSKAEFKTLSSKCMETKTYEENIKSEIIDQYIKSTIIIPPMNKDIKLIKLSYIQEMPQWIVNISTNDDKNESGARKIYNFNNWINALLENLNDIYEYKTVASYHIMVRS